MTSSTGFAHSRVYEPGRSTWLVLLLATLTLSTIVSVVVMPWPTPLRGLLCLVVTLGCILAIRRHGVRRGCAACVRVERLAGGRWRLTRGDGRTQEGPLHPDSFAHPWLVVVGIGREFVPIPMDALPAHDHRRLRVWMRWSNC